MFRDTLHYGRRCCFCRGYNYGTGTKNIYISTEDVCFTRQDATVPATVSFGNGNAENAVIGDEQWLTVQARTGLPLEARRMLTDRCRRGRDNVASDNAR